MTKKELERRIIALEAQVAMLSLHLAQHNVEPYRLDNPFPESPSIPRCDRLD